MIANKTSKGIAADNSKIIDGNIKAPSQINNDFSKNFFKIKNNASNDNTNHGSELIDTDNNKVVVIKKASFFLINKKPCGYRIIMKWTILF